MAEPLLEVRNLRIEFPTRRGTLVAVDDVSISITQGEALCVVGESGADKSLTDAAIIGLLEPSGRIAKAMRMAGALRPQLAYERFADWHQPTALDGACDFLPPFAFPLPALA